MSRQISMDGLSSGLYFIRQGICYWSYFIVRRIIEWIKKLFVDEELNKKMDRIEGVVEEEVVEKDINLKNLINSLPRRGFIFNQNNNRWSRTWTAKTRDGEERTLEVYEKQEDGKWVSLMYGNEGDIYYQHTLGYADES